MKLARKLDRIIDTVVVMSVIVVIGVLVALSDRATFATNSEHEVAPAETTATKYVTFYDGGEKLIVKTDAHTVGEAIERADVVLNDGDIVEPGLDAEINMDNYYVNIYRARPVVVKDGAIERYIMTASYDYKTITKDAGLVVYDGDKVELAPSTNFLETGVASVYEITRNGGRTITVEEEIPFSERTERDANMANGTTEVRQLGEVGVKRISYNVQYINNEEVVREVMGEEVVREPVERVVAVGVKKSIPPEWGTCAEWARAAGVSEEDLSAALDLIYHESGCRVDAQNPSGAYGIPQALPGNKMASVGADWETNPVTQIRWMIGYVNGRYGGWSQAIEYWYSHGWY